MSGQSVQRYYDPQLQVFYSVDPVTALQSPITAFHRYRYANSNPYRFTDPDGRFGLVGALIGGGIEFGLQMLEAKGSFSDRLGQVDVSDVLVASAVGAVTGGVGGRLATSAYRGVITSAAAIKQTAAVGAVASATGSATQAVLNGENPSAGDMAIAAVAGAAGSAAGARIGTTAARTLDNVARSSAPGAVNMAAATQAVRTGTAAEATTTIGQQAASIGADAAAAAAERQADKRLLEP